MPARLPLTYLAGFFLPIQTKVNDFQTISKPMKKHTFYTLLTFSVLFSACQTMLFEDDVDKNPEATTGVKTMYFRMTGINMDDISEITSAESGTKAASGEKDVSDNLLMGIYDMDGNIVDSITYQHKDDTTITYGTFSRTLRYGKYKILALGWNGTQKCQVHHLDSITFSEKWVPNTFLCLQNIIVNENYSDTRTLSLKRCVAKFKLTLKDEYIPEGIGSFCISFSKSGNTLNSETRHCNHICEHQRTLHVNEKLKSPVTITSYCFLPQDSTGVDITVNVLDQEGMIMESKTFTGVPMKINYSTNYSGKFFPYNSESGNVTFENDFDGEIFHEF